MKKERYLVLNSLDFQCVEQHELSSFPKETLVTSSDGHEPFFLYENSIVSQLGNLSPLPEEDILIDETIFADATKYKTMEVVKKSWISMFWSKIKRS